MSVSQDRSCHFSRSILPLLKEVATFEKKVATSSTISRLLYIGTYWTLTVFHCLINRTSLKLFLFFNASITALSMSDFDIRM